MPHDPAVSRATMRIAQAVRDGDADRERAARRELVVAKADLLRRKADALLAAAGLQSNEKKT